MRVLLFGMRGVFSRPPFEALLASSHEIAAVVVPSEQPHPAAGFAPLRPQPLAEDSLELPLLSPSLHFSVQDGLRYEQSVVQRAWQAQVPVYAVNRLGTSAFLDWVRQVRPDVACVACFDRVVPPSLLAIPRHGFLNLHPARLPHYRGPEPLFWQFRDGVNPVGVTVHWMDEGLDTGDIAAQIEIPLPGGIGWMDAERRCGEAGGALLVEVLDALEKGTARRHPQPEEGSYQPMPAAADFSLELDWTARRAFNFMRGTQVWGVPYKVEVAGAQLLLAEALDWIELDSKPGSVERHGNQLRIGFAQGVLVARFLTSSE